VATWKREQNEGCLGELTYSRFPSNASCFARTNSRAMTREICTAVAATDVRRAEVRGRGGTHACSLWVDFDDRISERREGMFAMPLCGLTLPRGSKW